MHFLLTYDIHASGPQRTPIETSLQEILRPHNWVKPLTTTYIIQVAGQQQWNTIHGQLTQLGNTHLRLFNFIMTPLIQGGRYDGFINPNLWSEINARSI